MLIIDPQKVNSISCKRFANILDRELHGNSPSIASASPEVVRCIRNTLSSVLRNMEDVQRDDTVDRLRNHVEIIDNLPQPSLMEEFVEEPAPAIAALGTLSRANDGNVSNSATKAVSNSNEESTEEEGANIQYLLQSQKVQLCADNFSPHLSFYSCVTVHLPSYFRTCPPKILRWSKKPKLCLSMSYLNLPAC